MFRVIILISLMAIACGQRKTGFDNSLNNAEIKRGDSLDIYSERVNQKNDESLEPLLLRKGLFQDTSVATNSLEDFQRSILGTLVKNGDGEFETDSTYVIEFVHNYVIDSDTIFYTKGQFLPSSVDFHFYGGYNKSGEYYDIYHLPLETSFSFTKYEVYDQFIRVYGKMRDNNFQDPGEILLFQLSH